MSFKNSLRNHPLIFSVILPLLLITSLALAGIWLQKPTGSIHGEVQLELPEFHLGSTDIKKHKVYAIAYGPRGTNEQMNQRGVWVKPNGEFSISNLPVGEYTVRVNAKQFVSQWEYGVFVDEAQETHLKQPMKLAMLEPSVNVASNSRVFTTKETAHFWINTTGATQANVAIYPVNVAQAMQRDPKRQPYYFGSELSIYRNAKASDDIFSRQEPIETLTRHLEPGAESAASAHFKLTKNLKPGDYIALVKVNNEWNQSSWNLWWFTVTNLGLIVKQSPEKTVARAIDLDTLQPKSGVNVSFIDLDSHHLVSGKTTGSDGFASIPTPSHASSFSLIAYGSQGHHHAYGSIPYYATYSDTFHTYFYTERPVYRLGQTVYYKGLVRKNTSDGYKNPSNSLSVRVGIEDPDNTELWSGTLKTSPNGSFHGTFDLPKDGKTGAYQLVLTYPDGTVDYESVEVAQYRKPEYQVEVTPLKERYIAGNTVKARVKATYFFGAPVTNARVKYTIYSATDWTSHSQLLDRPEYSSFFDDWNEDEYSEGYAGDYIAEGYATLNDSGEAIVEFKADPIKIPNDGPLGSASLDKRYTIQAEVTDISRISVVGNGSIPVSSGEFALMVTPKTHVVKTTDTATVELVAIGFDRKPIANQDIEVDVRRWAWHERKNRYIEQRALSNLHATTNSQGKALLTFELPHALASDTYTITAHTHDHQGNNIVAEDSLWIANPDLPYIRSDATVSEEAMAIKQDKSIYDVGDTAKILISAPVTGKEGVDALVAVEGPKLYDLKVVPLTATAQLIEVPIKPEYAPNVFVTVTFVGKKHQFYNQTEMIKVSPHHHFLDVAVSTDKTKYKPGDTIRYTVKVTDYKGQPAKNVELSLGVVDESIYSIRPEYAQDIRKFFFEQRENAVLTVSSFPEEYSAGPDKMEPRIRKNFRDTAAWFPTLMTNAQGLATATFALPDNLTTWRATVRGISTQTDVGSAVDKVISTKDLLLRLALPRFFTLYDRGIVTAIVHNYTDQDQHVHLSVKPSEQFETNDKLNQDITIKPNDAYRLSLPVNVVKTGEATVLAKAIGSTDSDAMELTLPVHPLGIETSDHVSTSLNEDNATWHDRLKLPEGVDWNSAKLQVGLSASTIAPVLGNFDKLFDYPYGCNEQTMSRLMPAVIAVRLHQALNIPLPSSLNSRFGTIYSKAIATLTDSQNSDGGWGWWKWDGSSMYISSYVLEGFYWLKQAGYSINPTMIANGERWLGDQQTKLLAQLQAPKTVHDIQYRHSGTELAYATYVLGLYGHTISDKDARWMARQAVTEKETWHPIALSYLTLAFTQTNHPEAAQRAYKKLMELANQSTDFVNWEASERMAKLLGLQHRWDMTYRFGDVETTAVALQAMLAQNEPTTIMDKARSWVMLHRDKNGWDNTKTTVQVMKALMNYEMRPNASSTTDFTVSSNLPDWVTGLVSHYTDDNKYTPEQALTAQGKRLTTLLTTIKHRLSITKTGPGTLFINRLLSYFSPMKPGDKVNANSFPQGLWIERQFFRIQANQPNGDGLIRFKTVAIPGNTVKAGETVLMKVVIHSPVSLPYTMVEAALPSGGEVISNDPRQDQMEVSGNSIEGDWGSWWWSHMDVLDNKMVFFATTLPQGKAEFHALVRMELPGTFQLNPVQLVGMYAPHVQGYSNLDSIQVVE